MATCHACQPEAEIPDREIIDHLRLFHPDVWDQVECWPDGSPVFGVAPESTDAALGEWLEAGDD